MGIGDRLKLVRRQRALTQVGLAQQSRVGLRTIRQIEQEDFEPTLATARKLATTLCVRVEWLVFGLGSMTAEDRSGAA